MTTRVTITVPDELHRAIQSARGWLLKDRGIDLTYSAMIEMLAVAGAMYFADEDDSLPPTKKSLLGSLVSKDYGLAWSNDPILGFYEMPFGDLASEMLPPLLRWSKARYEKHGLLKFDSEQKRKDYEATRAKWDDAYFAERKKAREEREARLYRAVRPRKSASASDTLAVTAPEKDKTDG